MTEGQLINHSSFLALVILLAVNGPNDASVASTLQKAGMVQFRAGNLDSGRLFLEKAVETYRQSGKGYESELITPLFIIGNIHKILKQEEEAQRVWNDAFEISKTIGDNSNPEVHKVLTQLLQASPELTKEPSKEPTKEPTQEPKKEPTKEPTKATKKLWTSTQSWTSFRTSTAAGWGPAEV